MIRICDINYLTQCVEIAFERNNLPQSNCAYCPNLKENIRKDFEFIINDADCLMVGYFIDGKLTGFLGCFMNPENNWVDCVGPYFENGWNHTHAKDMFLFAKASLSKAARFNFYFHVMNQNCHRLMESLSAQRQDNEYILLLNKKDYKPQQINSRVERYSSNYEAELIRLHDNTFPDVYVTGKDIIASIGKTREAFCAFDERGAFAGYGVLKYDDDSGHLTAELFAVKKEKRGKGYGWALLNTVVDSAFNRHYGNIVDLVVDKLNANARELYYACGFKLAVENEAFCIRV